MDRSRQIVTTLTHIRSADPIMRRLMDAVGSFTLRPERRRWFSILARAIISQQVSTAAAGTIRGRLEGILDGSGLTAEGIARIPVTCFGSKRHGKSGSTPASHLVSAFQNHS